MGSVKGKDTESSNKEIEMSTDMVYTDNPILQNMSGNKDATGNNDADSRVHELEIENAELKSENTDLKIENTILQEENKELKSNKHDNNTDNKSADL